MLYCVYMQISSGVDGNEMRNTMMKSVAFNDNIVLARTLEYLTDLTSLSPISTNP